MKLFFACLLFLFAPIVSAGEVIQDVGAFEVQFTDCMMKLTKESRCMERFGAKHVLPGGEPQLVPAAQQLDEFALKWLAKQKVFAVHPITKKRTGEIFQLNTYLIEDDTGALMIFYYSIFQKLGKWYVYSVGLNSNNDALEALLKGK